MPSYNEGRKDEVERRMKEDKVYRDLYKKLSKASNKGDIENAVDLAGKIVNAYQDIFEIEYLEAITSPLLRQAQRNSEGGLEQISEEKPKQKQLPEDNTGLLTEPNGYFTGCTD